MYGELHPLLRGLLRGAGQVFARHWRSTPLLQRFWNAVTVTYPEGGCWLARRSLWNRNGYGRIIVRGVRVMIHRWCYERVFGSIPRRRPHLDHVCRVRACAMPYHVEPVTNLENQRRMQRAKRRLNRGEGMANK